jgi:hypothetical protein
MIGLHPVSAEVKNFTELRVIAMASAGWAGP